MIKKPQEMTFNELKIELGRCKGVDPTKESIIRKLMVIKYNQHVQHMQQVERMNYERNIVHEQKVYNDPLEDEIIQSDKLNCRKNVIHNRDDANDTLTNRLNCDL